jgi:uncharacterized membrane protein YhaH (DUF805 family)
MNWYLKVIKMYAIVAGRARRKEFWYFVLFSSIISIILSIIDLRFETIYLGRLYSVAVYIPTFAVGIRRMHDVDKGGIYFLIPIINIFLLCMEGTKGSNKYGEDPKAKFDENIDDTIESIGKNL